LGAFLKGGSRIRLKPIHRRVHQASGDRTMEIATVSLNGVELMSLEAVFMVKDKEEGLRSLLEVVRPKLGAKGSSALDLKKGTGIPR
jgi:hypothetical protein